MYLDLQNKAETQTDVASLFQLNLLTNTFPIIISRLALHKHTFKNTQLQQHLADKEAFICLMFGDNAWYCSGKSYGSLYENRILVYSWYDLMKIVLISSVQ